MDNFTDNKKDIICRICFQKHQFIQLIQPCNCSDFVHEICLSGCRNNKIDPYGVTNCSKCNEKFSTKIIKNCSNEEKDYIKKQNVNKFINFVYLLVLFICFMCSLLATAIWKIDMERKKIPELIQWTMQLTIPFTNDTTKAFIYCGDYTIQIWRYYAIFAVLILCISVAFYDFNFDPFHTHHGANSFGNCTDIKDYICAVFLLSSICLAFLLVAVHILSVFWTILIISFIYASRVIECYAKKHYAAIEQLCLEHRKIIVICNKNEADKFDRESIIYAKNNVLA
jgi:hypothetical protein